MKKRVSIILLIMIVLGVSGCMSNETNNPGVIPQIGGIFDKIGTGRMEKAVLTFLNKKYAETFIIDKLTLEFGGEDVYYRAVFHSEQRPEKGVLYCRETGDGISVQIDGVACVMEDDYANVILQESYAAALQEELGEGVLVKCRLKTPDAMVSGADYAAGFRTVLEDSRYGAHVYVVILADASAKDSGLKEKAEAFMGEINGYRQYLYLGYQAGIDLDIWQDSYLRNVDRFESFVEDSEEITRLEYTAFHKDKGIVKQLIVKE